MARVKKKMTCMSLALTQTVWPPALHLLLLLLLLLLPYDVGGNYCVHHVIVDHTCHLCQWRQGLNDNDEDDEPEGSVSLELLDLSGRPEDKYISSLESLPSFSQPASQPRLVR